MKKGLINGFFVLLFLFVFLFSSSFVSSISSYSVRQTVQSVIDFYVEFFEPILRALFGGFGWTGLYLFERLLIFVILVSIVYLAVGRISLFEEQKTIRWIISVVVPLLGVRFISPEWLHAIFTQYTILAIILTAVIPFLLYFFFVYNVGAEYDILRKILWLLFIGIYAGLWSTAQQGESTIYAWTTIAAIICLIFDTKIMRRYRALEYNKNSIRSLNSQVIDLDRKIESLNHAIANSQGISKKENEKALKDLLKHRAWLLKQI